MDNKIYIEIDGIRYSASPFLANVRDGVATLVFAGHLPLSFSVSEETKEGDGQ